MTEYLEFPSFPDSDTCDCTDNDKCATCAEFSSSFNCPCGDSMTCKICLEINAYLGSSPDTPTSSLLLDDFVLQDTFFSPFLLDDCAEKGTIFDFTGMGELLEPSMEVDDGTIIMPKASVNEDLVESILATDIRDEDDKVPNDDKLFVEITSTNPEPKQEHKKESGETPPIYLNSNKSVMVMYASVCSTNINFVFDKGKLGGERLEVDIGGIRTLLRKRTYGRKDYKRKQKKAKWKEKHKEANENENNLKKEDQSQVLWHNKELTPQGNDLRFYKESFKPP